MPKALQLALKVEDQLNTIAPLAIPPTPVLELDGWAVFTTFWNEADAQRALDLMQGSFQAGFPFHLEMLGEGYLPKGLLVVGGTAAVPVDVS